MDDCLRVLESWEGSVAWNLEQVGVFCGDEFQSVLSGHPLHLQVFHYLVSLGLRVAFHWLRPVQDVYLDWPVSDYVKLPEGFFLVQV